MPLLLLVPLAFGGTAIATGIGVKLIGDEVEDFSGKALPNLLVAGGIGLALYAGYKMVGSR